MDLCYICFSMLKDFFKYNKYKLDQLFNTTTAQFSHLPHMQDLPSSAKRCRLCALMKLAMEAEGPVDWESCDERLEPLTVTAYTRTEFLPECITSKMIGLGFAKDVSLDVYAVEGISSTATSGILKLKPCAGSPAAISGDVFGRPRLQDFCSDEAFSLVRSRVSDCIMYHKECSKTIAGSPIDESQAPKLPTRVIDVGPVDGSRPIRLLETNGSCGHYTALSHCWGLPEKSPLRTTTSNLREHLNSISIFKLPKTFQDAVMVTRAIDLQYLWIDSLCIIQDDNDDWLRESQQMGALYERARVTIAASGAKDSSEGCFLPLPAPECTVELPYFNSHGLEAGSIFVAKRPNRDAISYWGPLSSPLRKRAWATQEWILSRRTLHFTKAGLIWSCRALQFHGIDETGDGVAVRNFWDPYRWADLLQDYSKRQLTYPSDILLALLGITNQLRLLRQDEYYMGCWMADLPGLLLWVKEEHTGARIEGIPSWSWASRIGKTKFWSTEGVHTRHWETICSRLAFEDQGKLAVTSPVRAVLCPRDLGIYREAMVEDDPYGDQWLTAILTMRDFYNGTIYSILGQNRAMIGVALFENDAAPEGLIHCLVLVRESTSAQYPANGRLWEEERKKMIRPQYEYTYYVLLLMPLPHRQSNFARVGMGLIIDDNWIQGAVEQCVWLI